MPENRLLPRILTVLLLLIATVLWTWAVFQRRTIPEWDHVIHQSMVEETDQLAYLRPLMVAFTQIGSGVGLMVWSLVGILWRIRQRDLRFALVWALSLAPTGLLISESKEAFDRPRPGLEFRDPAALESNPSYPSGHSMGSAIAFGMWIVALRRFNPVPRLRSTLIVGLLAVIAMVGLSRIFLRVHWFSDVIGGYLMGALWLNVILLTEVGIKRVRRRHSPGP